MPNYKGNEATLKKYKPKWKSGNTQTIRVPVALTDQILDYAHRLDEGTVNSQPSIDSSLETLTQVIEWLESVKDTPRNNFSKHKRELILISIEKLKSLLQVNH